MLILVTLIVGKNISGMSISCEKKYQCFFFRFVLKFSYFPAFSNFFHLQPHAYCYELLNPALGLIIT